MRQDVASTARVAATFLLDVHAAFLETIVQGRGYQAMVLRGKMPDDKIAVMAVTKGMPLITGDSKDFLRIYALLPRHPGLVVLPSQTGNFRASQRQTRIGRWMTVVHKSPLQDTLVLLHRDGESKSCPFTLTATIAYLNSGTEAKSPAPVESRLTEWFCTLRQSQRG